MKLGILGACGFVGSYLCDYLYDDFDEIVMTDVVDLPEEYKNDGQIQFLKGSITNQDLMNSVAEMCDVVLVIASVGMSSVGMMDKKMCFDVNVGGVEVVVKACKREESKVRLLIYTSSYNVCFDGKRAINGDETSHPPLSPDSFNDFYSLTKMLAEDIVLKADENQNKNQNKNQLTTLALRPPAIYGEGEVRHFSRICALMDQGVYTFKFRKGEEEEGFEQF